MRLRQIVTIVTALAAGSLPLLPPPAAGSVVARTRIVAAPAVEPGRPILGERTVLRGRMPAARRTALLQRRRSDRWRTIARDVTGARGRYRFWVTASRAPLRVVAPRRAVRGLPRAQTRAFRLAVRRQVVAVAARSVAARGSAVTVRTTITPPRPGRRLTLEATEARGARLRFTLRAGARGVARKTVRFPRSGPWLLRVRAHRHRGAAAVSASRRVRVVPRPRPSVTAHRGGSAATPENTVPAIAVALASRADAVEVDVRRSADGVLLLAHDETFGRTTNVAAVFPARASAPVGSFTWEEIRRLQATGPGAQPAVVRIASLEDLFRTTSGSAVRLVLDIKRPDLYPGIEHQVVAAARRQGLVGAGGHDRVRFDCFDWAAARRLRAASPDAEIGLLSRNAPPTDLRPYAWADVWAVHARFVTSSLVARARRVGNTVDVWTVNERAAALHFADLGVGGIITDDPVTVLRLVR